MHERSMFQHEPSPQKEKTSDKKEGETKYRQNDQEQFQHQTNDRTIWRILTSSDVSAIFRLHSGLVEKQNVLWRRPHDDIPE